MPSAGCDLGEEVEDIEDIFQGLEVEPQER